MCWPLWPPAWDCYHRSTLQFVLRTLPQTHRGREPWKTSERKNKKWKPKCCASSEKDITTSDWYFDIMPSCTVPQKCYILAGNFPQFIKWSSLPRKAVVGVVVRHDGGGANLAQFVLWTVQTPPHCMQVVLSAVPHWTQRKDRRACFTSFSKEMFLKKQTRSHTCM